MIMLDEILDEMVLDENDSVRLSVLDKMLDNVEKMLDTNNWERNTKY